MLSGRLSLLPCPVLITALRQDVEKCSLSVIPSSRAHFLLHLIKNGFWVSFPPPVLISYYVFITKWWEMLSIGTLPFSSVHFLLHPFYKMMRNALLAPFPPPVPIPYCILITKWWEILSWRLGALPSSSAPFLLHPYHKNDGKCFLGHISLLQCHFLS